MVYRNSICFSYTGEIAYFDTVTNDPTLMEISVATHQTQYVQDMQLVNPVPRVESDKDMTVFKEEIPYYCNECQRSLHDKKAFEKHLKSELHFKRSLNTESLIEGKQLRNKTKGVDAEYTIPVEPSTNQVKTYDEEAASSRYQICPTCHSTVETLKLGKHLISHYHHHMSLSGSKDRSDKLILENIDKIVKECPFQCQICHFYCNWEHDFAYHWQYNHENTTEHITDNHNTGFWCTLCQVFTPSSKEMSSHLVGEYHNEILSVINRCVPMKIKVNKIVLQHIYCF